MIGIGLLNFRHHRPPYLDRRGTKFLLHGIRAVVSRAALDHLNVGIGHEAQYVARFEPDVLHTQVTGHVVAHLA
jgi:hypothetical protein